MSGPSPTGPPARNEGDEPREPKSQDDSQAQDFRHYSGKVSRQSAIFLSGTFFTALCGYVFKAYVSRQLGAGALGLYALGMATITLGSLTYLGLPQMLARFVASHRAQGNNGRLRGLLTLAAKILIASTGFFALLMVLGRQVVGERFFGEPELVRYLPLFALLLPIGGLNALLGQYLRGHEEVSRRTLINHFFQFPAKILLTLGFFTIGWGLSGYVAAEIGSQVLSILLLAFFSWRFTPPADQQPVTLSPEEKSYATNMVGQSLLTFLNNRADIFVLGVLLRADQVGIYSIAIATGAFVPTLLRSVNSIFGPVASNLHARGELRLLERLFQTSTKWCLGLTWPLVGLLVFFSEPLMGVFGDEFRAGGPALALIAIGHLVNVGTGSVGNLLNMSGHQRLELRAGTATAILILALDFLWIPKWGLVGAAMAVATGLAMSNLLRVYLVHRFLGLVPYNVRTLRLLLPIAASGLSIWGIWSWSRASEKVPELLAIGIAGIVAYSSFLAVAALTALDPDDQLILQAIKERLARFRPGAKSA